MKRSAILGSQTRNLSEKTFKVISNLLTSLPILEYRHIHLSSFSRIRCRNLPSSHYKRKQARKTSPSHVNPPA